MIDDPTIDHTSLRIQGFVIGLLLLFIGIALALIISGAEKRRDRTLGAVVGTIVGVTIFFARQA